MRYAVAGGWFLDHRGWEKFDRAMCEVVRQYGYPSALICGHMPGAERFAAEWGRIMLVPSIEVIDVVMPAERARTFVQHAPQVLLCFSSGSPANVVLRDHMAARLIPVVDVAI